MAEHAIKTYALEIDRAVTFLINGREVLEFEIKQTSADFIQAKHPTASHPSCSNKSHAERITCLHPNCTRSRFGNGYPHHLDQQAHMREMHGWSNGRDILKGLSVDGDDFIRDRSGNFLAIAWRLPFANSPVGHQVGESGQIRDSQDTLLGMALYDSGAVRLLEQEKQQPQEEPKEQLFDIARPSSPKIPSASRNEDQEQRMYMHYTISRDMTGSNDEVATKLLAALGERSRGTRFRNADLTLLGTKK